MDSFKRERVKTLPLTQRDSKLTIEDIAITPDKISNYKEDSPKIRDISERILDARNRGSQVILAYGAHLIKNGLGPILNALIKEGYVTHLATNGAGSIHDWEIAYQGKTGEDVKKYTKEGQFGIWEETGRCINLAIAIAAAEGRGYGEGVGKMISEESITLPETNDLEIFIKDALENGRRITGIASLHELMKEQDIKPGTAKVPHPYKEHSVQRAAYENNIPMTIHPGFGYDIIYTHPYSKGASIGISSETDFLRYAKSVSKLEGGVYLSVGSSVMSPMIFEKSLSMARNVAKQEQATIEDFTIVVNDLQEGKWEWNTGKEPPKTDPSYYLRFCKTFSRMGAKEMHYIQQDNRTFLTTLYSYLSTKNA